MPNLTNIPALDVVIGLAFVYFMLSLVISSATEMISSVVNIRWKKLQQGLRELFGGDSDYKAYLKALEALSGGRGYEVARAIADKGRLLSADDKKKLDANPTGKALREILETHGLATWKRFADNPRMQALWKQSGFLSRIAQRGPSYVPPSVFALTLLDTLAPPPEVNLSSDGGPPPTDDALREAAEAATDAKTLAARAARTAASRPTDKQAAAAAKASADDAAAKVALSDALVAAKAAADAKAESDANPADAAAAAKARAAAETAAGKAAAVKAKEMASNHDLVARAERAAGTVGNPLLQKWLLDALTEVDADRDKILKSLGSSFDSVTNRVSGWYKRHAAIMVAVFAFVAAGALNVDSYAIGSRLWKDDAVRGAIAAQATNLADGTVCPPKVPKKPSTPETPEQKAERLQKAKEAKAAQTTLQKAAQCVTDLKSLGLPIGWAAENRPHTPLGWFAKALGMTATAFALMLGAPFWFDTLSKLARLRATGKPEGTAATDDEGKPKN